MSSPVSSVRYASDLHVDRRRRRLLLHGGALAWLAGSLLLFALPARMPLEAILVCLWTASSWLDIRALRRGMARIDRIRITSAGEIFGIAPDGSREALEILPGSMLLRRAAWLRLGFKDGGSTREWLAPGTAGREAWRLLQIGWRQRGGSFGRPPRS